MVDVDPDELNQLFNTLRQWNQTLEHVRDSPIADCSTGGNGKKPTKGLRSRNRQARPPSLDMS